MKKIEMSDKAITRRLKQTDQLRELSLSLMKAKRLHDEKVSKKDQNLPDSNEAAKTVSKHL